MLFAKNKPTETVKLGGEDFVELQHLSKGVLDEIKGRTIAAFADAGPNAIRAIQNAKDDSDIPPELIGSSGKMLEIQHYKVSKAIIKWSSPEPITEQTVKELDESVFLEILAKVDSMNRLTEIERKN